MLEITKVLKVRNIMASMIQVFGTYKCKDTQKAVRFFKERGIKFQLVDLTEKGLSKGELESVARKVPLDELIDKEGKRYKERNLEYMVYDLEEELLSDPLLLKTPVTRFGREAAAGYTPEVWKKWADEAKK